MIKKWACCLAAVLIVAQMPGFFGATRVISMAPVETTGRNSQAVDITSQCAFSLLNSGDNFDDATDASYKTVWTLKDADGQAVEFITPEGVSVGGLYFVWDVAPKSWILQAIGNDGSVGAEQHGGTEGYLTQYVPIDQTLGRFIHFRLVFNAEAGCDISLAGLSIYSRGEPPSYAPQWQTSSARADLMTITTHPDDEDLYLSVPAVTYAGEGKKCVTVFMTYGAANSVRRYEGQESVWSLGNTYYPVMRLAKDVKTYSSIAASQYWPLKDCVGYIVEQIRKYKPSIIVTHDVCGEYGHGAHMLTSYATQLAFLLAGDPTQYPKSAQMYGAWTPGKLYLHLYPFDRVNTMDLQRELDSFGGRTVYQVIADAYSRQKSQLPGRSLPTDGVFDMRSFGLCMSNIGADTVHDTMFEGVSDEAMEKLNAKHTKAAVDKSALVQALSMAQNLHPVNYTQESWSTADLKKAILNACIVLSAGNATQGQVNASVWTLQHAMGTLFPKVEQITP